MNFKMLKSAAMVAVSVGSVLLLINQFDALFGGGQLKIIPALLTYCVPFCVYLSGRLSRA